MSEQARIVEQLEQIAVEYEAEAADRGGRVEAFKDVFTVAAVAAIARNAGHSASHAIALREAADVLRFDKRERERLHDIIQRCYAHLDVEAHPQLAADIDAVLLPCDEAGRCVPPSRRGDRDEKPSRPAEPGKDKETNAANINRIHELEAALAVSEAQLRVSQDEAQANWQSFKRAESQRLSAEQARDTLKKENERLLRELGTMGSSTSSRTTPTNTKE